MKTLIIIGAGGFGREVLAWARQSTAGWSVKGFLDDNAGALDRFSKDVPVIGRVDDYEPVESDVFVCAMGRVEVKRRCVDLVLARGGVFAQVVHETVVVGGWSHSRRCGRHACGSEALFAFMVIWRSGSGGSGCSSPFRADRRS